MPVVKKRVDSLTGLPDRKALEETLTELIAQEKPVALALLDLDNFLEINTRFGSEKGDQVLQSMASILTETNPDAAYRVSGDEFAVVLAGTTLEHAFLKMESLRAHVHDSQSRFELPDNRSLTITVGVAQYPRDAKDFPTLNKSADAALMTAKEQGRNQVALPPNEEMVMKSCYYPSTGVRKLKALAESLNKKESILLREALNDLLRKYDQNAHL